MLDFVVGMARSLSEDLGLRYVTLDALNEGLVSWYGEYGFVRNHGEEAEKIAWLESVGQWKPGDELRQTSMRFDIKLEEEVEGG